MSCLRAVSWICYQRQSKLKTKIIILKPKIAVRDVYSCSFSSYCRRQILWRKPGDLSSIWNGKILPTIVLVIYIFHNKTSGVVKCCKGISRTKPSWFASQYFLIFFFCLTSVREMLRLPCMISWFRVSHVTKYWAWCCTLALQGTICFCCSRRPASRVVTPLLFLFVW